MPESYNQKVDRRRFPRVKVPVLYRPAEGDEPTQPTVNISPKGLRIYSNLYFTRGHRMDIELLLPDKSSIVATVRVIWQNVLPPGSVAIFDMGLEFLNISPEGMKKLKNILKTGTTIK